MKMQNIPKLGLVTFVKGNDDSKEISVSLKLCVFRESGVLGLSFVFRLEDYVSVF